MKLVSNELTLTVVVGDITEFPGDAIVNPANTLLIMGGGVAGAIKKKGGEEIEKEARKYAPLQIGKAIATTAGKLKCKTIIHAPTVEKPGSLSSYENVYKATKAAIECAKNLGFKTIAFPLMGTGVGGITVEQSIEAMVSAFKEYKEKLNIYIYVLNNEVAQRVLKKLISLGFEQVKQ